MVGGRSKTRVAGIRFLTKILPIYVNVFRAEFKSKFVRHLAKLIISRASKQVQARKLCAEVLLKRTQTILYICKLYIAMTDVIFSDYLQETRRILLHEFMYLPSR